MSRHTPTHVVHPTPHDWEEYERLLLEWYPRPQRRRAEPALLLARAVLVAVFATVLVGLPPLLRTVGAALG